MLGTLPMYIPAPYQSRKKFAWQSINKFSHSPSAVGLDFAFVGSEHVYGIPQHADTFSLKDTTSTDPYRYSSTVLALPKIYIIKRYIISSASTQIYHQY